MVWGGCGSSCGGGCGQRHSFGGCVLLLLLQWLRSPLPTSMTVEQYKQSQDLPRIAESPDDDDEDDDDDVDLHHYQHDHLCPCSLPAGACVFHGAFAVG